MLEHLMYKSVFEMSADRLEFVSNLFSRRAPPQVTADSPVQTIFQGFARMSADAALAEEVPKLAIEQGLLDSYRHVFATLFWFLVLPGPAGGELANVNRWRNQIGLPPLDETAMAAARKTLDAKAGPISLYDFTSDGQKKSRVVAGLAAVGGSTWFVKMAGDEQPVATARIDFIHLLESLRRDDAH